MSTVLNERLDRVEEIILDMVSKKQWKRLEYENKEAIRTAVEVDTMNDEQEAAYKEAIKEIEEGLRNVSEHLLELVNEYIGLDNYAAKLYEKFYDSSVDIG
jgi:TRAP-type mannitol/chloroaromatic compound transport system substrate-binding protein